MFVASFQKNSPGWQIELRTQRLQEWWELTTSQIKIDSPNLSILDSSLVKLLIKFILWSLIAIILVWLVWQIWLLLHPIIRNWQRQQQRLNRSRFLKNPKETELSPEAWLTKAQQYYQEQNYRQGIFCLYQGILQYLSDRKVINSLSSRTDEEYLTLIQQLKLNQFLSYKLLFSTHEKLCFSDLFPSAAMFDKCRQAYHAITSSEDSKIV